MLSTPPATRSLRRQGFHAAVGLATWDEHAWHRDGHTLTVTAMPGRHGPGLTRYLLPAVMGSLLTYRATPDSGALRIYISGDTLLIEDLREIPRRFDDYGVFASPRSDFTAEINRRRLTDRIAYVERGQTLGLSKLGGGVSAQQ